MLSSRSWPTNRQAIGQVGWAEMIRVPGGRIGLRPITKDDTTFVVRLRNSPEVVRWLFSDEPVTVESHERFLDRLPANDRLYIAQRLDDEIPVGMVGLVNIDRRNQRAEFGRFAVDPNMRRKGYAREMLLLTLLHGFEDLGLHRLWLEVLNHNEAASHLYQWSGFAEEGCLRKHILKGGTYRDIVVMGLLREEYLARRRKLAQDLGWQLE